MEQQQAISRVVLTDTCLAVLLLVTVVVLVVLVVEEEEEEGLAVPVDFSPTESMQRPSFQCSRRSSLSRTPLPRAAAAWSPRRLR